MKIEEILSLYEEVIPSSDNGWCNCGNCDSCGGVHDTSARAIINGLCQHCYNGHQNPVSISTFDNLVESTRDNSTHYHCFECNTCLLSDEYRECSGEQYCYSCYRINSCEYNELCLVHDACSECADESEDCTCEE